MKEEFYISAPNNEDELNKFLGKLAIYNELGHMGFIRICDLEISDWGVRATIETIATYHKPLPEQFSISAAWDVFSYGQDSWYAPYVSWNLCFNQKDIDEFLSKYKNTLKWYKRLD